MLNRTGFLAALLMSALITPALAQEADPLDPGAALEADPLDPAGDLGGAQLIERKKKKKKSLADPDPKARDALDERRSAFEKRVNKMQGRAAKYADSEEAMGKVMAAMLKSFDAFFPKQRKLLEEYRAAVSDNRKEPQKKLAKQIAKMRKGFMKRLEKLEKSAEKVEALIAELAEKVKAEEAEGEGDE